MIRFGEFESLGLSLAAVSDKSDGDSALALGADGIRSFCGACGIDPAGVVRLRQVHGARIVEARISPGDPVEADGLITRSPGCPIAVGVADCVPVFLFDPLARCAALVHAGREGTLRGIIPVAVTHLAEVYGTSPRNVHALVGPSAGPCCYEVSVEMAENFSDAGLPSRGRHLDLWAANSLQLVRAGVPEHQVQITGICTICDGRFHSYRADASPRRNMAVLMI